MNHGNGSFSLGDGTQITHSAIGNGATNHVVAPARFFDTENPGSPGTDPWDVGVVTILPEETRAVIRAFGLTSERDDTGLFFRGGTVDTGRRTLRVAAVQTHGPGQRSVMSALDNLRRRFAPRLWVLVGIGGGLHPEDARIGNVIVSTRVVYYDQRKITAGERVQHRGEEREAPAGVVHAVNAYFTDHGSPARIRGQAKGYEEQNFSVLHGLIGSGEAVIANRDSEIRGYLKDYNDKVLAVDMESGGLSQYWQEGSVHGGPNPGWVVVRGVSDNADQAKNDDHHVLAARNAAFVARELLPYLC